MPASTLDDALEIASDVVGRSPTITHLHNPPILMADVSDGGQRRHGPFALRRAARAAGQVERMVGRVTAPGRNVGFPYRAPTVPRGVEVPEEPPTLGADYDTDWARTPLAERRARVITEGPMRLAVRASPTRGVRNRPPRRPPRRAADDDAPPPPLIFAPNHHSHLDTGLMVRAVPYTWRKRLVVAAAADYFFDKRWKATLAALSLNAIPIDRESTGRRSADMIRDLVDDGWSLVIYPEGGRSPDGWGRRSRAAPPTSPDAPEHRSSRCSSTAPARSSARG